MLTKLNCDDYFTMYTNTESLCCIPETNMLYINYTSREKKEKREKKIPPQVGIQATPQKGAHSRTSLARTELTEVLNGQS